MNRPALEDQIVLSKMTGEELIECLMPHGLWQTLDFWIYIHCGLLWHIIHWSWFDVWEGSRYADECRPWYIKLKRKIFGGNKMRQGGKL